MKKYLKLLSGFFTWQMMTTAVVASTYLLFLRAGMGLAQSVFFSMLGAIAYTFFLSAYLGDVFMPTTELSSGLSSVEKGEVSFVLAVLSAWAAKASELSIGTAIVTFASVFITTMVVTMEAVIVIMALLAAFAIGSGVPHYAILSLLGANLTVGFTRRVHDPRLPYGWAVLSSCVQAAVLYWVITNGTLILLILRL